MKKDQILIAIVLISTIIFLLSSIPIASAADISLNKNMGYVGETITVEGGGFDFFTSSVIITFDGVDQNAAININGLEQFTATFKVPTVSPGNYIVSAKDDSGNSDQATFTVMAPLAVVLSPSSGVMDDGQSKMFTAVASGGSGSYSYRWYVDGSSQGGQTASTFSFSPKSAGSYSITATITDSLDLDTTSAQSPSASVTVNAELAAPTLTATPGKIDQGQTSVLSSSAMSTGTLPYTFQWLQKAPGAGSYSTIIGATSSSYSFTTSGSTATGTWNFELQVTDAAGAPSVTSSAVSVVVNSALVAPSVSASVSTVTKGQSSALSSSAVSSGSSPYTFQWLQKSPGAGSYLSISGATSSTYSFVTTTSTTTGDWSFELQVTDSVSSVVTSNAVSVTVNEPISAVVSPSSWVMDVGQSMSFTATAIGGSGSYPASGYHWYVDGSVQSGQTAHTFSFSSGSAGFHSISATVTDSLGTTSAQSPSASVSVAASPSVAVTPTGPVTMDMGQVKIFTATATGGSGTIHYQWYLDSSTVGSDNASYSYSAAGTSHSITCKVTDSASSPVTSSPSNAVSVTVNSALVAPSVSASLGTVDQGQTSVLSSSAVSTGTAPFAYQWLQRAPGDSSYSLISGATSSSYSFVTSGPTATGTWRFELQVTDAVSAVVTSNAVSVTVNVVPTVTVSTASWTLDIGQSRIFSASASGGSGSYPASGYQWYVDGSLRSGATASTFNFTSGSVGSYSITVTVTDSSGTTSAQSPTSSVTVNTSPTVTVAPVGPLIMNAGQNQTFTATSSGGSGTIRYQWYLDNSTVGSNNASYSYTASGTSHSVTCKVSDSASTPVTSQASNAVSIAVNPTLVAPTISASAVAINQGQTSSLTSTIVSSGTSPYTYQWLQKAPGGSYAGVGSNSASFSFVTTGSFATGIWSFILQVRDSTGAAVNSTAVTVTVNIAPLDHFVFSTIGTQTAGTPFTITITAKNAFNSTLINYGGTNILSASTGTISPATTGSFSNGVWTGGVMVTGAGSGIWIITSGSGMSGTSGTFSVNPGVLDHFFFSTIDDQIAGSSFSITVIAKDIYNNTITSYNGSPSLTCSSGDINPGAIDAFFNGVGSTSVTVASSGQSVTITATDGSRSVASNVFRVTNAPTPTPTVTPTIVPHSTPLSTPSSTSTPTTSNGSKPSPTLSPDKITLKNLTATVDDGSIVYINISGNIIESNISNVDITADQLASRTTLSLTLIGPSGTYSSCNITIPKNAVTFGKAPTVYVNSQLADYDYNQDANNYYVWYTTYSNTYELTVTFTETSELQLWSAVLIAVISVILVVVIVIPRITGKSLSLKSFRLSSPKNIIT